MEPVGQVIRDFVTENFFVPDAGAIKGDTSLLDAGIVDSTGVLEMVEFLEQRFSIKIEDAELLPENLDSIDRMVALVARKTSRAA